MKSNTVVLYELLFSDDTVDVISKICSSLLTLIEATVVKVIRQHFNQFEASDGPWVGWGWLGAAGGGMLYYLPRIICKIIRRFVYIFVLV